MPENKIELRSDEVQDVLSKPPHILIRTGSAAIAIICLILSIGCYFFTYPEVVKSEVTITTENPPIWFIAGSSGLLRCLNCKNNQSVNAGAPVAIIENTANTDDVLLIEKKLNFNTLTDDIIKNIELPANVNLGSIQPAYSHFLTILYDYRYFIKNAEKMDRTGGAISSEYPNETNHLKINLQLAYHELLTAIKDWELAYLLKSPSPGILSYNNLWNANRFVNKGDTLFSIMPAIRGKIIGRLKFPVDRRGKVKTGQPVHIRINGYPYMEYGYLTGNIETISSLPNGNWYFAVVQMPQQLITSFNKNIPFMGELRGTAEIITNNISLAHRILSPIKLWFGY